MVGSVRKALSRNSINSVISDDFTINKKTKRLIGALFFLLLVLGAWFFYSTNFDKLPPKTPIKIARYTSGLNIPDEVEIVFFERNEQTFGGDYSDKILIQLTEEQTKKIKQEWNEKDTETSLLREFCPSV